MKKLVTLSLVLGIACGLMFADASAGIKEKKATRVGIETAIDVATTPAAQSPKPLVQKATSVPADGVTLGTTDYDYSWNSGNRRAVAIDGAGKAHFQWMQRDGSLTLPASRRAIVYNTYDWSTGTLTTAVDVKAKSVAQTGFGSIDVFKAGDAAGIAVVCGHTPNWFAIDGGPGTGNFTVTNIRPTGSTDPSLTIDQATNTIYWTDNDGGRANYFVQKSTDYGSTWAVCDSHLVSDPYVSGNLDIEVLVAPNGNLFVPTCLSGWGTINQVSADSADCVGYYKSTDQGSHWTWTTIAHDGDLVAYGSENANNYFENFGSMDASIDKNNNLHIVIQGYGSKLVYRTTDTVSANYFGALYWKTGQSGFKLISRPQDAHIADFDSSYYTDMYAGNAFGHPYPSICVDPTGNGLFAIWSQTRITTGGNIDLDIRDVPKLDLWYAYSQNLGTTWSTAAKLANTENGLFASCADYLTKPNGTTYRAHFVYIADSSNLTSTTWSTAAQQVPVVYRTIDFAITGVNDNAGKPAKFSVDQNFPNPFNPTTEIRYEIGSQSMVTLKVYNIMGQEVATLVNEIQNQGNHSVTFDASKLASGVYLYKLQSGSFVETKKMTLMK